MLSRDDEVLNCFFEESSEQLANVGDDLLEQQQGDDIDSELANCIFRAIHAVKGGSFFFGLDKLGDLAHPLEVIIDRVRRHELALNPEFVGVLILGGRNAQYDG